ncbi:Uroporphyrin-III c-methyltransferase [Mycena kentingensis (nom. inval.)]|nr:Uroporphyrin-III c-methyltransferase [Mycena kentingensis (nom. inval.)]
MARFLALLSGIALAASLATANAAAIDKRANLITFFLDINFSGESVTFVDSTPTGCIKATPPYIASVSSVIVASGIECILWSTSTCGGSSITVGGSVPSLVPLGFNDKMVAYECFSA